MRTTPRVSNGCPTHGVSLVDRIERGALQPLPAERFERRADADLKVQFN